MNKLESIIAVGAAGAVLALVACTADKLSAVPAARTAQSVVIATLASPCTMPPAAVQVNINQVEVAGSTATIKVNPGTARVPQSGGSVQWKFNANGYGLAANAVTFKPSQPPGPSASAGDRTDFYWCFAATAAGSTWNYNVSFSPDSDPTKIYDCDPTIINSVSLTALVAQTFSCRLRT